MSIKNDSYDDLKLNKFLIMINTPLTIDLQFNFTLTIIIYHLQG